MGLPQIHVNPSLKSIEAVVEVEDDRTIIPRNCLIEVNQSGLLMETMIDFCPRDLIPKPSFGPLDPNCVKEGVIIGVANTYALVERTAAVIEEARLLLLKVLPISSLYGNILYCKPVY
ncbi:hypothetical protein L1987_04052 [Smallanthus sonchifolius]|uniref:Uncharacterized protein n=1 Tax=Smallanthus sonchifolius TaxID=185202 RepID=A0ACB9KCC8_9ASTR|nr:hypothetical protein L1987_04052 [Smallanthus sonchifolius]